MEIFFRLKSISSKLALVLAIALAGLSSLPSQAQEFGSFQGPFDVRMLPDGRNMMLLRDVTYIDRSGHPWTAPKGAINNGASIPRSLWTIIGAPFSGKYRNAAVIHDHFCDVQTRGWKKTHLAFYYASRTAGVTRPMAKTMYYAVYRFGPRWLRPRSRPRSRSRAVGDNSTDSSKIVFKPKIIKSEFETMKARIERGGVDIAEIENVSRASLRSLSRGISGFGD